MRAVVQRVSRARVEVEGRTTGEIGEGLLVLVGVAKTDAEADAAQLAEKIAGLRLFNDDSAVFHSPANRICAAPSTRRLCCWRR